MYLWQFFSVVDDEDLDIDDEVKAGEYKFLVYISFR